ncbi:hypothetical protein LOZ12_003730 [Ophidiomyces ophidiicola]|uniref:Uncharacterized protein n=1 Tax=Ophidiomyces ophidiicola TaxID=1387563 RepID=A0ACB8UXS8_9EURO|nr:hypothetical protein LOZ64_006241 [Ophidiomyces ophidiicola]KAI1946220.1 hypothetical protein LOZ62_003440 [Ophidiomyces ophidiicola]KAI2038494.1 hypothetical protein LOZ47_003170 [Ophidiomyces ophidiicola]KAI2106139.1 hypothetical protein LOZ34_003575 [Ophidiomyces ophidiicola]KAI2117444.1 hypothetical protein LOZ42_002580 [Ophidiomyces ophidiicola]
MPQASQSRSKATTKSGSAPTTSESSNSSDQNDEKSMPENLEQRPSPTPGKWDPMAKSLRNCSWEQLQERFIEAMDERSDMENALQKETADLLEVFIAWSQTTVFADEDRAYKRFKTRMDYVQTSEDRLEDKKQHYANVVKAFESALALLRDD